MACPAPEPDGAPERPLFIEQLLSIPPARDDEDDELDFQRLSVVPRDVDFGPADEPEAPEQT